VRYELLDHLGRLGARVHDRRAGRTRPRPLIDGVEGVDVYLSRHLPQLLVTLAVPRAMVEPRAFLGLAPALLPASLGPRAWGLPAPRRLRPGPGTQPGHR
jgi:ABC-type transport system involved in cytochrome bd biosynthesis fused ATPase/permease subunit